MNWRYIIIVMILATIVSGWILWLTDQKEIEISQLSEAKKSRKDIEQSILTNNQISDQSADHDYKKIISLSFDYGSDENQFGISRIAGGKGPSSFYTDNKNNLYVIDENKIKIFDSNGKQLSMFATKESLDDIAVDDDGNIYGYNNFPAPHFFKYTNNGSLQGEIIDLPIFSEIRNRSVRHLYIVDKKLYISDNEQNSYLISSTEKDFKFENPAKINGVYGYNGNVYKLEIERWESGKVNIFNSINNIEKNIFIKEPLVSTAFLGEDKQGNIYIQGEVGGEVLKLKVFKYDQSGRLLANVDISENDYSVWTSKLLHISQSGDIWQVMPGKSKLLINRWTINY